MDKKVKTHDDNQKPQNTIYIIQNSKTTDLNAGALGVTKMDGKKHKCLNAKKGDTESKTGCWMGTKTIFTNIEYVAFTCGQNCALMLVYFIPFVFLPDLAITRGVAAEDAARLMTFAGIASELMLCVGQGKIRGIGGKVL